MNTSVKHSENTKLKIILIGNYAKDKQMSMELFANLLRNGYINAGNQAVIWRPPVVFGRLSSNTLNGFGKWLAYIDKWLIFPILILLKRCFPANRKFNVRFHICDHSNVIYLPYLPNHKTVVTCHDVLAIRGALGHKDAYCEASSFGIILQHWILGGLVRAKKLAAVSATTLKQLNELDKSANYKRCDRRLVLNAFNESFQPVPKQDALRVLSIGGVDVKEPFLLHIGSSLPRKNRKLLIDMLELLQGNWNGKVVLAGQEIDPELYYRIQQKNLKDRVIMVKRPNYDMLNALYSACDAFVFPSYSEGFGWPIIEAQACGAPVIASNIEPIPEVAGGAALHCNPDSPSEFVEAFKTLSNEKLKSELVQKGFVNCNRFKPERMIQEYLEFHLI